jgi:hypothetical protein
VSNRFKLAGLMSIGASRGRGLCRQPVLVCMPVDVMVRSSRLSEVSV